VLYFFHGQAVVAHGLAKEKEVPDRDLNPAMRRKVRFEANPSKHALEEF
jgi:hypothetical protein